MSETVCPACGSACPPGTVFCTSCGLNFANAAAPSGGSTPADSAAPPAPPAATPAVGPLPTQVQLPRPASAGSQTLRLASFAVAALIVLSLIAFGLAIRRRLAGPVPSTPGPAATAAADPAAAPQDSFSAAAAAARDASTSQALIDSDIEALEDDARLAEAADEFDLQDWAARYGLLTPGGQVDAEQTLIYAAGFDDLAHLKAALQLHPDLAALSAQGYSALHTAAFNGSRAALLVLLQAGAQVDLQAPGGEGTPLHQAAASGDALSTAILLRYGADSEAYNGDGLTPLMVAVSLGNAEAAQLLLNSGASVDSRSRDGLTALMAAAQSRQPDMLSLLLANGAAVGLEDPSGWSALHFAAAGGDPACINVLDSAGASREARDAEGNRPVDVARKNGNQDAADLL